MKYIFYKRGYKYQLVRDFFTGTNIKPNEDIVTVYIKLTTDGSLTIKKGYAWDGASGPTIDTLNFMKGSLVHDALYQLMREGYLSRSRSRKSIDKLLQIICRMDGMCALRAWLVYQAVRLCGNPSSDPANKKPIIKAPKLKRRRIM